MSLVSTKEKPDARSNVDRATEIFDEHGEFIRSVIDFNVKDEALSDDIFQDFFLFLVSKPIPQEVQNVKGFLYKVISDTIKDAFRRIGRYQKRIYGYAKHRGRIVANHPEDSLIEIEEMKKMFDVIERCLPRNEALAVTLRYRDNCDTAEVAEKMRVKPRSVSSYVSVGLKKIRHVLIASKEGNHDSY